MMINVPAATTGTTEDVIDPSKHFKKVLQFVESTATIVLSRLEDLKILSYTIVKLAFLLPMACLKGPGGGEPITPAISHLDAPFPWHLLCLCLNFLQRALKPPKNTKRESFPARPRKGRFPRTGRSADLCGQKQPSRITILPSIKVWGNMKGHSKRR